MKIKNDKNPDVELCNNLQEAPTEPVINAYGVAINYKQKAPAEQKTNWYKKHLKMKIDIYLK